MTSICCKYLYAKFLFWMLLWRWLWLIFTHTLLAFGRLSLLLCLGLIQYIEGLIEQRVDHLWARRNYVLVSLQTSSDTSASFQKDALDSKFFSSLQVASHFPQAFVLNNFQKCVSQLLKIKSVTIYTHPIAFLSLENND